MECIILSRFFICKLQFNIILIIRQNDYVNKSIAVNNPISSHY